MSPDDHRPSPARPKRRLLRWVMVIVLLFVFGLWLFMRSDWVSQDACLDSGGRWIDGACEGARTGG